MKLPVFWLRDYLPAELTGAAWEETLAEACRRWELRPHADPAHTLAELFTFAGFACDGVEGVGDEAVLDLDVLSNRPDAQCVLGLAREAAAFLGVSLREPEYEVETGGPAAEESARVSVEEPKPCPRYTARIIRGLKVGPSPEWLVKRLRALGLTPRNNIVDVTNFILFELNHPLHAFDLNELAGRRIIVRRAREGEEFTPLYDRVPLLTPETLLIADAERGVAIGGVIGGKGSEVSAETTDVLLEAATFDPAHIRRTCRRLKVGTDSSYRFERGVDADGLPRASARAARLIVEAAGGTVAPGLLDSRPEATPRAEIRLRDSELRRVGGLAVPWPETRRFLSTLGCEIVSDSAEKDAAAKNPGGKRTTASSLPALVVRPPTWRRGDLEREIDLIEEVLRLYGFNHVPAETVMRARIPPRGDLEIATTAVRRLFTALGYFEAVSDSLTDPAAPAPEVWTTAPQARLTPESVMREDRAALRHNLTAALLAVRRHNRRQRTGETRLFECGRVFLPREGRAQGARPAEKTVLALLDDRGFAVLADAVRRLPEALSWPGVEVRLRPLSEENGGKPPAFLRPETACCVTARRSAVAEAGAGENDTGGEVPPSETPLGIIGVIGAELRRAFELQAAPAVCELDLDAAAAMPRGDARARPLPVYPEVVRDMAVVVDERTPWAALEEFARREGEKEPLRDHGEPPRFLDIYRGKQIGPGKKSAAFSVVYRSPERTLTDEEVNAAHERFTKRLLKEFNAVLRA